MKAEAETPHTSDVASLTHNFMDLCSPSPNQKSESKSSHGYAKAEPVNCIIDLCTPEKAKRPKLSLAFASVSDSDSDNQPVTPIYVKKEKPEAPSVIDLCTPNQSDSVTPIKREFKTEKPDAPSVIDISMLSDKKPTHPAHRPPVEIAPGVVRIGALFNSWEEAQSAIYTREERLGHHWRIGQSKTDNWKNRKKITFRCNHYYQHVPVHSIDLDPADHRKGKSIRTDCQAHVNVSRQDGGKWRITLVDWEHNHPREIPEGGSIRRPATEDQKMKISQLANATSQTFSRGQIAEVLKAQSGECPLEPRQITNAINKARREAREEVDKLGGDMHAI
ncbi:hypothetical protein BDZ97DRAFT_1667343, partial [Flammula alnicola]